MEINRENYPSIHYIFNNICIKKVVGANLPLRFVLVNTLLLGPHEN